MKIVDIRFKGVPFFDQATESFGYKGDYVLQYLTDLEDGTDAEWKNVRFDPLTDTELNDIREKHAAEAKHVIPSETTEVPTGTQVA